MTDTLAPIKLTDKQKEHVKMRARDFMGQATYIRALIDKDRLEYEAREKPRPHY